MPASSAPTEDIIRLIDIDGEKYQFPKTPPGSCCDKKRWLIVP
jgi:hypothetical protein